MSEELPARLLGDMSLHYVALLGCIVLTACAQLLLKRGASRTKGILKSFWNSTTLLGYALFMVVTVLSVYAMQRIELKEVTVWISGTYLLVVILSRLLLRESLTLSKIIGCVLVVMGAIVFALA